MSQVAIRAPFMVVLLAVAACSSGQRSSSTTASTPSSDAATVDAKDIARDGGNDMEKILAGKVAGVVVGRAADGGLTIRIRGSTSVYGNNEPLYVLDGMAITPGPGGSLVGVNPYDIESIRVLKDATDTAVYGSRGANGVIIIKTKKAKKPSQ